MTSFDRDKNKVRKEFSELSLLSKLAEMMSSDISLEDFLDFCVASLAKELEAERAGLFLTNGRNGKLIHKFSTGLSKDDILRIVSGGDHIVNWVMEERESLIIIDELMDPGVRDDKIKTIVATPLKIRNTALGLYYMAREKPAANFTAIDLELTNIFSAQSAFAIEISRLAGVARDTISELNKLNRIGKMLTSSFDTDNILKIIVGTIKEMINIEFGGLLLVDSDNQLNVTIIVPRNASDAMVDKFENTMVETMRILTMDESVKIKTKVIYNERCDWADREETGCEFKSLISVPIIVRETVRGILNVVHTEADFFTKDNLRTLSNFATQISIALENARTYGEIKTKVKEQDLLMEVSKALTSTLDLDKVLKMVIKITADLLDVRMCALRLYDRKKEEFTVKASFGLSESVLSMARIGKCEGVIGKVFNTGKPIAICDISKNKFFKHYELFRGEGIKSMLSVPLSIKSQVIGVLTVFSTHLRFFDDNEIDLLSTVGRQAAAAIENARLYTFMHENFMNTIKALSAAIDTKDHYTHGHSKNVMDVSAMIAAEMGMPRVEVELIRFAGLLHDIGKIGVSESILSKKSSLTDEEFAIISTHPKLGTMIMESVDFLKKISPITYHHHERWDGRGYPMGLKGDRIPLGARIIAVSDAYDAITSSRSYSSAKTDGFALDEIRKCSGTQFDPEIVDAFIRVMERIMSGTAAMEEEPFLMTEELMEALC